MMDETNRRAALASIQRRRKSAVVMLVLLGLLFGFSATPQGAELFFNKTALLTVEVTPSFAGADEWTWNHAELNQLPWSVAGHVFDVNATFGKDVIINGTLYGSSPVRIVGINLSDQLTFMKGVNGSLVFSLQNTDSGTNATSVLTALNDAGHSMNIGIGSSTFEMMGGDYSNITAMFSRSRGKTVFANFYDQPFLWYYNPSDDNDRDNLVEIMSLGNDGLDLFHVSNHDDDHAFEIVMNASGHGDAKALDIDFITGNITTGQDEEAILINIDDFASLGGTVIGVEIITTEGLAHVYGLEAGATVNPILQLSGVFSNESSGTVAGVDRLSEFLSVDSDIPMFVDDDDNITIGSAAKFEEIEVILDTVSSGSGIAPVFEFSTGAGTWTVFSPTDGTNAFRNNGVIAWLDEDVPTWATSGGEYLVSITRTKNSLMTNPIEDEIRIVSGAVVYKWDSAGNLTVNGITANALTGSYAGGVAFVCVWDNGTIFAQDSAC